MAIFEMNVVDGWRPVRCWLVGPFAIHRAATGFAVDGVIECNGRWKISHAATGMGIPWLKFDRQRDAVAAARELAINPDWRKLKRGERPDRPEWPSRVAKSRMAKQVMELRYP